MDKLFDSLNKQLDFNGLSPSSPLTPLTPLTYSLPDTDNRELAANINTNGKSNTLPRVSLASIASAADTLYEEEIDPQLTSSNSGLSVDLNDDSASTPEDDDDVIAPLPERKGSLPLISEPKSSKRKTSLPVISSQPKIGVGVASIAPAVPSYHDEDIQAFISRLVIPPPPPPKQAKPKLTSPDPPTPPPPPEPEPEAEQELESNSEPEPQASEPIPPIPAKHKNEASVKAFFASHKRTLSESSPKKPDLSSSKFSTMKLQQSHSASSSSGSSRSNSPHAPTASIPISMNSNRSGSLPKSPPISPPQLTRVPIVPVPVPSPKSSGTLRANTLRPQDLPSHPSHPSHPSQSPITPSSSPQQPKSPPARVSPSSPPHSRSPRPTLIHSASANNIVDESRLRSASAAASFFTMSSKITKNSIDQKPAAAAASHLEEAPPEEIRRRSASANSPGTLFNVPPVAVPPEKKPARADSPAVKTLKRTAAVPYPTFPGLQASQTPTAATKTTQSKSSLESLPGDLLVKLLGWLDENSLARLSCVSRRMYSYSSTPRLWQRLYELAPVLRLNGEQCGWKEACRRRAELQASSCNGIVLLKSNPSSGSQILLENGRYSKIIDRGSPIRDFQKPTFSPCGNRIVYCTVEGLEKAQFTVTTCNVDGSDRISFPVSYPPFYFSWSPNSRFLTWISHFINRSMTFRLVDLEDEETFRIQGVELERARPVFYSWSSDSKQVVVNLSTERLRVYTIRPDPTPLQNSSKVPFTSTALQEQGQKKKQRMVVKQTEIFLQLGSFIVPIWYPIKVEHSDCVVFMHKEARDKNDQRLVLYSLSKQAIIRDFILFRNVENYVVRFVFSPNLRFVATLFRNRLYIFDVDLRPNLTPVVDLLDVSHPCYVDLCGAFFWDRKSTKIAYVRGTEMRWVIWDVVERAPLHFTGLGEPTKSYAEILNFFDQHFESPHLWSADCNSFLVCSAKLAQEDRILRVDLDGSITTVGLGTYAMFSPQRPTRPTSLNKKIPLNDFL